MFGGSLKLVDMVIKLNISSQSNDVMHQRFIFARSKFCDVVHICSPDGTLTGIHVLGKHARY